MSGIVITEFHKLEGLHKAVEHKEYVMLTVGLINNSVTEDFVKDILVKSINVTNIQAEFIIGSYKTGELANLSIGIVDTKLHNTQVVMPMLAISVPYEDRIVEIKPVGVYSIENYKIKLSNKDITAFEYDYLIPNGDKQESKKVLLSVDEDSEYNVIYVYINKDEVSEAIEYIDPIEMIDFLIKNELAHFADDEEGYCKCDEAEVDFEFEAECKHLHTVLNETKEELKEAKEALIFEIDENSFLRQKLKKIRKIIKGIDV
jgi:hypothetical protein